MNTNINWYAQFCEDKKLVEFLGDKPTGFYIDIGAWDHELHSVTKHFYDKGWNGINVEPIDVFYQNIVENRKRDINVNAAISIDNGKSEIFYLHGTGLSTLIPKFGETNPLNLPIEKVSVKTLTLSDLCKLYVPVGTVIDFLKIDVEGNEELVIKSGDWDKFRPNILCIEATEPMTMIPSYNTWDGYLIEHGYVFICFEGVNRWYREQNFILSQIHIVSELYRKLLDREPDPAGLQYHIKMLKSGVDVSRSLMNSSEFKNRKTASM